VGGARVSGQADKDCIGKQSPKNGRFFRSIAGFGVVLREYGNQAIGRSGNQGIQPLSPNAKSLGNKNDSLPQPVRNTSTPSFIWTFNSEGVFDSATQMLP
jgi:hypothetical protein